uniref:Uncharacterized protein n=1 Tax=Rhizophora mucronata TaxID=61149 RepID=A0A2P2Q340_RHIMU
MCSMYGAHNVILREYSPDITKIKYLVCLLALKLSPWGKLKSIPRDKMQQQTYYDCKFNMKITLQNA